MADRELPDGMPEKVGPMWKDAKKLAFDASARTGIVSPSSQRVDDREPKSGISLFMVDIKRQLTCITSTATPPHSLTLLSSSNVTSSPVLNHFGISTSGESRTLGNMPSRTEIDGMS